MHVFGQPTGIFERFFMLSLFHKNASIANMAGNFDFRDHFSQAKECHSSAKSCTHTEAEYSFSSNFRCSSAKNIMVLKQFK
jgi:hypothetical protein